MKKSVPTYSEQPGPLFNMQSVLKMLLFPVEMTDNVETSFIMAAWQLTGPSLNL